MADSPKMVTKAKKAVKFVGAVALAFIGIKIAANFARSKAVLPQVTQYLP